MIEFPGPSERPRLELAGDWLPVSGAVKIRCSQPGCKRPAVMVMIRRRRRPGKSGLDGIVRVGWGCCDLRAHSYGRVRRGLEIWWDPLGRLARADAS